MSIQTPITKLFGIKHPILLAGMNQAAGPELAAAVTNAGGLGVIGGVGYTPSFLKVQIAHLKKNLKDKNAPFGIDLLLPKVGGTARKTNYDYTKGSLPELIHIICASGCKLFVSAVGVPEKWVVDELHKAGILIMNMVGAPKHVKKALAAGVDLICAQGGEGGGHTGDVPTSILIPEAVDLCKNAISPLTGEKVHVIAAGGIYNGRSLAMALCLGAQAVWVGTRFICAEEAGAPKRHKAGVINAGFHDTIRTIIFTGRPMRVLKNDYIKDWEENKSDQIKKLTAKGIIPVYHDFEEKKRKGEKVSPMDIVNVRPLLMGKVAACVKGIQPAAEIIDDMIEEAVKTLQRVNGLVVLKSKL